ncbi:type II toxin-antitoxin system HicB family antitoxin [Clostridioides sp. ZZV13-5731]|uniref:type II toxin-antitoxin system HicB family antitoxin n=1 Tax=unclassified Clostridioides TaxID=2635829 RepID=UPI001D125D7B|nr:type II toxin-antitoxin system HicB family antitoxin [Clostridioides sp. ES-S-0001-02]MCC0743286.1 type II toxin-antitoxin system HicB family antitoxin [Clostridioides sp. ZZV14-6044]MCC0751469.1 type II toxin-antitoxin system HicB family antitoxin [Clostridioides sp. ZZV13-5731]
MYKNDYIFPATITKHDDNDYEVNFFDFDNIVTYGETLENAYLMAEDALKLELFDLYSDTKEIPTATNLNNLSIEQNQTVILVKVSLKETIKQYDGKYIKKSVSIPSWLEKEAKKNKINFSQTLQEALKDKLDIN